MEIITLNDAIVSMSDKYIEGLGNNIRNQIDMLCYICQECQMSSDDNDCECCDTGGSLDNLYDELNILDMEIFKRKKSGGTK
ncbi:MAG: hypothetical protein ACRDD8_16445 [Bacteroidales bacterium]